MILLDTDHLSVLRYGRSVRAERLVARMEREPSTAFGTSIVCIEEGIRGWMASIAKEREPLRQTFAYRELFELIAFASGCHIALFDDSAARQWHALRASGIRVATQDLKIAAISLHHDALLLTANKRDFEKVPGLRFANWMDAGES